MDSAARLRYSAPDDFSVQPRPEDEGGTKCYREPFPVKRSERIETMNIIQELEREQAEALAARRATPDFTHGDTVKVWVKVREGEKERLQAYEGVVIARGGAGIMESFTVRKISYGEGVERVFPIYSPNIDRIEVLRRGKVRRAKLYYLRDRRGKSARIFESTSARTKKIEAGERVVALEARAAREVEREAAAQALAAEQAAQEAAKAAAAAAAQAEAEAAAAAKAAAAAEAEKPKGE